MLVLTSKSEGDTDLIALRVASQLKGGEVIALEGEMGAGKTRFVRGLVRALGGDIRQVSSPTFVIMNIYQTPRVVVYHLDAYRVTGEEDLEGIGFSEVLSQGGVVIVEWASRVISALGENPGSIRIEAKGETEREFTIQGIGDL